MKSDSYFYHTEYKRETVAGTFHLGKRGAFAKDGIFERLRSLGLLKTGAIDFNGNPINYTMGDYGFIFVRHLMSEKINIEEEIASIAL